MEMVGEKGGIPGLQLNADEQHHVEEGEEHTHVAGGSEPQLNIGHILEGALNLGHACHETKYP